MVNIKFVTSFRSFKYSVLCVLRQLFPVFRYLRTAKISLHILCTGPIFVFHLYYRYSVYRSDICISLYITDILCTGPIFVFHCTLQIFCVPVRYFYFIVHYRYSVYRSDICISLYITDILCTCPVFVSQCALQIYGDLSYI